MRKELYNWKYLALANKVADSLEKKGHEVFIVRDGKEALKKLKELMPENSTVATGGSLSLTEIGGLELLRSGKYNFLDRYSAKTKEEKEDLEKKAFYADYYICSANAITEKGDLVFLDGTGNRVAAVIYGPKNVILIASINKVVKDVNEARERIRFISPMNSKRLNLNTPCTQTAQCVDCASHQRICNYFVVVESGYRNPGRFKIILTLEELGL